MTTTSQQEKATSAPGNVLIMAGAGTGKTHTLVERCLRCLLNEDSPANLDEILMVTFTEAAAAEMRQRIRARIEQELLANPQNQRAREQLGLFETAHIGTLHGFCLQLVRQHFYLLELDPQSSVTTAEEAGLLADEELDRLLRDVYAGEFPESAAVERVITTHGDGSDKSVRALILRLHAYSQTLPDPSGWYARQITEFSQPQPPHWENWLESAFSDFRAQWLPFLQRAAPSNELAKESLDLLAKSSNQPTRKEAAPLLAGIIETTEHCPKGKKGVWLDPLEDFYADARFLFSLSIDNGKTDPLADDWKWIHSDIATILKLAREFNTRFARTKRELAVLDFHDLEQFALQLLWDHQRNTSTPLAQEWQKKFRYVMVDEYQDINAAQDKILQALSRSGAAANRFLVGDVKQSIYRFRLAAPKIFQEYATSWSQGSGTVIPLTDNFRSREGILDFVNSVFSLIMRADLGGVTYDANAQLRFGAPEARKSLSATATKTPPVELHLRLKRRASSKGAAPSQSDAVAELSELEEAAKEARLVAIRLQQLKCDRHLIWDEEAEALRPVDWKDMAILLRSPSNKAESYAKEFSRLNIPLSVARTGFYDSIEISDLLNLLKALDNPLQDIPLLALLHSPLGGLDLEELAVIRLAGKGRYWLALRRWHEQQAALSSAKKLKGATNDRTAATLEKASRFLDRYSRWRKLVRHASLSTSLEQILVETHYGEWLLTQTRGEQRYGNLQRLLGIVQKFDQFQRQGLFRFLRFVEAQQSAEAEPPVQAVAEENAVRLLSIHQSKGLEFPVVVLANAGKGFNLSDMRDNVLLDDVYGIGPQIKPPNTGKRYPSLPNWLARRRTRNETLGEEMRLLYVAATRARDLLVITASISESKLEKLWRNGGDELLDPILNASSYADWLGFWFAQHTTLSEGSTSGMTALIRWQIHDDSGLAIQPAKISETERTEESLLPGTSGAWRALEKRLAWKYPFPKSTLQPAKSSVTLLRQHATALSQDEEAAAAFNFLKQRPQDIRKPSGADAGSATHAFLQHVSLSEVTAVKTLEAEGERLVKVEILTAEQVALIDYESLAKFWNSDPGAIFRTHIRELRRELAFTARLSLRELDNILKPYDKPEAENESDFVVVQGVADLALIFEDEIRLLDFKTDRISAAELDERVKQYEPQISLYALALSKIYRRPVKQSWLYFLSLSKAVELPIAHAVSRK